MRKIKIILIILSDMLLFTKCCHLYQNVFLIHTGTYVEGRVDTILSFQVGNRISVTMVIFPISRAINH